MADIQQIRNSVGKMNDYGTTFNTNKNLKDFKENISYLQNDGITVGGYNGKAADKDGGTVKTFSDSHEKNIDFGRPVSHFLSENMLDNMEWDKDNDGNPEITIQQNANNSYTGRIVNIVKSDENSDGNFEAEIGYDLNNNLAYQKFDVDDDGILDYIAKYSDGVLEEETFYLDEDGKNYVTCQYNEDETIETEYNHLNAGKVATTKTTSKNGKTVKIEEDTNGDGKVDFTTQENKKGEMVRKDNRSFGQKIKEFFKH